MRHALHEAIHVDLRVGDEDYSGTYGPGDVDLPDPVAEVLAEHGLLSTAAPLPEPVEDAPQAVDPVEDVPPVVEPEEAEEPKKGRRGGKTTTNNAPTEA